MVEGLRGLESGGKENVATEAGERRKLQRLPSRDGMVTSSAGEFELVNISPTGIAIRGHRRRLTIGGRHLFVVRDRGQSFEVTGEVRWLIPWTSTDAIAGVAFVEILRAEDGGIWGGVTSYGKLAPDDGEGPA